MANLVGVHEEGEEVSLGRRQLPITVYDNKIMTMQLGESCAGCEFSGKRRNDDSFSRQYSSLSKGEVTSALVVPSKVLFTRLAQTVACVGCRRSVERLFNQLKDSGHPALEPLVITSTGILTVHRKHALQPRLLSSLFTNHGLALNVVLESIPKLKKSGRCLLHSMEGVRCRGPGGGRAWREVWEVMGTPCREAVTLVSADSLLATLDNYLRKHRFCHECKNKVHRAFDLLVGEVNLDPAKEKGYVATLYAGIRRCEAKRHIHVPPDTEYITHIITRAEPELQGRRERHAKTLEIAQEEVLTCLGLFLYERLQRIHTRMKEEEQTWDILFHVALDALYSSFQLFVEDKQGYSKFEMLCEELQRQELREKAKKEKKNKKKKKNKKNEEGKENSCLCEDEEGGCRECELNMASSCSSQRPTLINATNKQVGSELFCRGGSHLGPPLPNSHLGSSTHHTSSSDQTTPRCSSECGSVEASDGSSERGSSEEKDSCDSSPDPYHTHHHHNHHHHHHHSHHNYHKPHMECSASTDSLVSRCSQGSRDGGYCSAHNSGCSSRDSSEVACGEGLCSHPPHGGPGEEYSGGGELLQPPLSPSLPRHPQPFTLSLQQMLDEPRCEDEDEMIPEAEVRAWRARLGAVRQKRAELRQTLKQRFQQFCHRGCEEDEVVGVADRGGADVGFCLRHHPDKKPR
ncbi:hypothetical protein Pcinc_001565 [Petrolisthes cinctipes]|uniref:Gametogenetin-binding protein 2 n=1 Tax=Petrolisthes cinctipes TaxID=88211 RepID=A0AAE1FBR8_PETCI|nr:hypothetical protein Pcinc_023607 [Petrolisthes cinctipes]KAK3894681.1 hypothetical protein Pcinc_001565 [Petrolisthes cinctipes]